MYEDAVYTIQDDTQNECFPDLPTLSDVPNNPLINPVKMFVDAALKVLKPVKVSTWHDEQYELIIKYNLKITGLFKWTL